MWHRDKIQDFIENVQGESFKEKIAHSTEETDQCIDRALGELTDSLMNPSACRRKTLTVGNRRQGGRVWFERECHEKKKSLRKPIAHFRKTGQQCDKLAYYCSREEYKGNAISDLVKLVPSWKEIRKHRGRKVVTNEISGIGTDWRDHFEKVWKTKALLFPFSSSLKPSPVSLPDSITLGSHNIPFSDSAKKLGVILDLKLSTKKHVIKKCQTAYFELKRISSIRSFSLKTQPRLLLLPISSHGLTTATVSSWVRCT